MPSVRSIISSDTFRHRLIASHAVNHCGDFPLTKTTNIHARRRGSPDPRRLELGSVGDNQQRSSVLSRSTVRPRNSKLVGSIQCTSPKIIRRGFERDRAAIRAVSASSVFCLVCRGSSSRAGYASSFGRESISRKQHGVFGRGQALCQQSIQFVLF